MSSWNRLKRRKRKPSLTVDIDQLECVLARAWYGKKCRCPCMECSANRELERRLREDKYYNKVSLGRSPVQCVMYLGHVEDESAYMDWWEGGGDHPRTSNSESCFDTIPAQVWERFMDYVEVKMHVTGPTGAAAVGTPPPAAPQAHCRLASPRVE